MRYRPEIHHRRSIRLKTYDYSQNGAYFVTTCAKERECLFGEIEEGKMILNQTGEILESTWLDLPNHYTGIALDAFVIMPNHTHSIIVLCDPVGAGFKPALFTNQEHKPRTDHQPSSPKIKRHSLSEIMRGFKTFSARKINEIRKTTGIPVWQRNYYERIIRDENELEETRKYIVNNPKKWEFDKENPNVTS